MRARAASTSAATRREVEQSIARFEKQLDGASDALQTLGKHLGRGAQGGYKEVTATLRTLRRDAGKANKQALKDFDKLREALSSATASTTARAKRTTSRAKSATTRSGARSTSRSTASRSTAKRSTAKRSTAARSTAKRATAKRSTAASRAKKS